VIERERVVFEILKGGANDNRAVTMCGLRSSYKAQRRTRILSNESIQVIHALKLAKSPDHVLNDKLSRLLKPDALNLFDELLRQNELSLSLNVTHTVSFIFNIHGNINNWWSLSNKLSLLSGVPS